MNHETLLDLIKKYFGDIFHDLEKAKLTQSKNESSFNEKCDCADRDCEELQINFYALVDHELPANLAQKMLVHVLNCPECADHFRNEYRIREIMRKSVADVAPESLRMKITQRSTYSQRTIWFE